MEQEFDGVHSVASHVEDDLEQLEENFADENMAQNMNDNDEGDGSMSSAKVHSLKQLIDAHLRKNNVYAEIRTFLAEYGKNGDHDMFDTVKEKKIIEKVLRSLETRKDLAVNNAVSETVRSGMERGKQYLLVKVLGGRMFPLNAEVENVNFKYVLRMHYRNQRFESAPTSCVENPQFDASFLVELSNKFSLSSTKASDFDTQVRGLKRLVLHGTDHFQNEEDYIGEEGNMRHQFHFVIVKVPAKSNLGCQGEIVSSQMVEWRRILTNRGGATVAVELSGLGPTAKIRMASGILDLRLDLVPASLDTEDPDTIPCLSQKFVDDSLKKEAKFHADAHRRFCQYTRMWWQEYVETNPKYRNRMVKIFAENEWGEHMASSTFVQPIRAGRLLETPRHAARFVSLLPYIREEVVGGGRLEVWYSPHSFLSKGQGDCEEHALLLCSLFLGFGLRAFVCVGTVQDRSDPKERDHVWVATLSGKNDRDCVFWESLTGQRVEDPTGKKSAVTHAYKRIACIFNHETFYANKQLDDRIVNTSFNVQDDMKWKAMDERLIKALKRPSTFPLLRNTLDTHKIADVLETTLKVFLATEREQQYELSTQWDDNLSYYLTPALSAYETERATGVLFGNQEFQAVIKRHIPNGHSFKGYPTIFNHRDPEKMFHALRQNPVAKDIIQTRADHTHFALRVAVYPYPENVTAVWVMLAVRSRNS